jgi:cobaltochelatase CobN
MHLLLAQPGEVTDGSEAVDLGQTPAELIVITAADTELAALAEARAVLGGDAPDLRLASLMHLTHPMSVDLYLDKTATKARLVVVRVLGGEGYWPYGLEQFAARLGESGIAFAALPGDDKPDEALWRVSTIGRADWEALWAYFVEGGPENASNFLRYCKWLLADPLPNPSSPDDSVTGGEGRGSATETPRDPSASRPLPPLGGGSGRGSEPSPPPAARPLLRAGVYWPGAGIADLETARANWPDPAASPAAPIVPIVFYRALVQGAGLHPVNRLTRSCLAEGLAPLPIFVASLKDPVSAATLAALFAEAPPAVVINATSFAVSSPQSTQHQPTPLDLPGVPVLQAVFSGGTEAAWETGTGGLSARDIAMNVALPEIDGRILARAISFKGEAYFDEATQCRIATYRARGDRIQFTARLAAAWARLGRTPAAKKRAAIVLANYPNKDGRLANGVGLDTPQSVVDMINHLRNTGYHTHNALKTSADLMAKIQSAPTNWLTDRAQRTGGETLSFADYQIFYSELPWEVRRQIEDRWGAPEQDPFFIEGETDCGHFALSILTFGNIAVGIQPARGYNIDPKSTYHAPDLVPPHNYLAFYAWLRREFRADAINRSPSARSASPRPSSAPPRISTPSSSTTPARAPRPSGAHPP